MSTFITHWQRALTLLDRALDLPPGQREPWLAHTAASEPDAVVLLRKLLAAHGRVETQELLATLPKVLHSKPLAEGGGAGMAVGPFELIEALGRGGMGSVWRARYADGRLKRDVAVKLPASTSDPAALATLRERFARERDFLAQLQHPHIARLYDAGVSDTGQPFLAMEYVAGQPIDAHCDAQRLPVNARLQLFEQVLSAVAYAHQQLVLHRDLKADNVLVDAQGQVRLLDFGVARLLPPPMLGGSVRADGAADTASAELTERAGAAFTLGHAAPEQLSHGALSTATDVYALGVMLYRLLTGLSPYQPERDTRGALEDAVLLAVPQAASSRAFTPQALQARQCSANALRKLLRNDLDVILAKALKKLPSERYTTVAALADDLRRHLAQQPISARPDSWRYRSGLFIARHRWAVAASAFATVALMTTTGVAAWQAKVSADNAARASREAARANSAQTFFAGLLSNADPEKNKEITALDRKVVDAALAKAERDFKDAPETLAVVLKQLADLYHRLGIPSKRLEVLSKRVGLLATLPATPVDDLVEVQLSLGEALSDSEHRADRVRALPTLLAARNAAQSLRATDALVVRALCQLADQLLMESKNDDADSYAAQAVAHAERTLPNPHPSLSWAYEQRAVTSTRLGRFDAARDGYRMAMAVDATGQGRGKRSQVNTRAQMANLEFMAGNYRAAKREALAAIEFSRAELGDTGNALTNLRVRAVLAATQAGDLDEAATLVDKLLEADLASNDPNRVGPACYAKGMVAMARGRLDEAAQAFSMARPGMAAHPRLERRLAAQTAMLKVKLREPIEAYGLLEPLVAGIRAQAVASGEEFSIVAEPAAVALAQQGRVDEARQLFEEACVSRRAMLAIKHPSRVRCESYVILISDRLAGDARAQALQQQLQLISVGRDDHMPLVASLWQAKAWAAQHTVAATAAANFPLLD